MRFVCAPLWACGYVVYMAVIVRTKTYAHFVSTYEYFSYYYYLVSFGNCKKKKLLQFNIAVCVYLFADDFMNYYFNSFYLFIFFVKIAVVFSFINWSKINKKKNWCGEDRNFFWGVDQCQFYLFMFLMLYIISGWLCNKIRL